MCVVHGVGWALAELCRQPKLSVADAKEVWGTVMHRGTF